MSEPVKLRPHNQAHCKDCSLAPVPALSLNLEDMDALDEIVKRGRPLKRVSSCSARVTISARSTPYVPAP